MKDETFISRWSRRKISAKAAPGTSSPQPAPVPPSGANVASVAPAGEPAAPAAALPPLESLTPESDFAPFMRPDVDPTLKGRALKALFSDPALYPMDGLDVYIDDYTQSDPLPEGWLEKLNQFAALDGPRPDEAAPQPAADGMPPEAAKEPSAPAPAAAPPHEASADPSHTVAKDDSSAESMNRGTI